jgi:hypothetical protein
MSGWASRGFYQGKPACSFSGTARHREKPALRQYYALGKLPGVKGALVINFGAICIEDRSRADHIAICNPWYWILIMREQDGSLQKVHKASRTLNVRVGNAFGGDHKNHGPGSVLKTTNVIIGPY